MHKNILKRTRLFIKGVLEGTLWLFARWVRTPKQPLESPGSIFVLRNNDIGDLLISTPIFEALRRKFPDAYIVAGVGKWNIEILKLNPHISEVLAINAPWHNKVIQNRSHLRKMAYVVFSSESRELARRHFDIGIDIVGSRWGSLLMLRAGIPYRLGVKGYAGGYGAVQKYVEYNPREHVCRSTLRFAELLQATELPEIRPQIFLSPQEREAGESLWSQKSAGSHQRSIRIVIGHGGGFKTKCWPLENYAALVSVLSALDNVEIAIVGNKQDRETAGQILTTSPTICNLAGRLSLRETFALVASADLVICNSSMLMHTAAAFLKPAIVLLGEHFISAKQHDAQWGWKGSSIILGKETGQRDKIYTPDKAMAVINSVLSSLP